MPNKFINCILTPTKIRDYKLTSSLTTAISLLASMQLSEVRVAKITVQPNLRLIDDGATSLGMLHLYYIMNNNYIRRLK
jgi:hypothetical protein